jgi:hypothetical protein
MAVQFTVAAECWATEVQFWSMGSDPCIVDHVAPHAAAERVISIGQSLGVVSGAAL